MSGLKQYVFRGRLVLEGVDFFVDATSMDDARAKARSGDFDYFDSAVAEAVDWTIRDDSEEENE